MRVLLDECVPRRLKRELVGHDVKTAPEMGWASKKNGELLALAAVEFDTWSRQTGIVRLWRRHLSSARFFQRNVLTRSAESGEAFAMTFIT